MHSPGGEIGMVEMPQALDLIDVCYEQFGDQSSSFTYIVMFCFIVYEHVELQVWGGF